MGSEQLPHLSIEDNPTVPSKKRVFLIAVLSFLLLSLPVGVYLVGQQQQLSSRASNDEPVSLEKSISLITPNTTVGEGQLIPIDIMIRSDNKKVNMASVTIKFNPAKVKVAELITNTAQTQNQVFFGKYWLSKGYDNDAGEITLVAGVPKPGVETAPGGQALLLAQVRFLSMGEGVADITVSSDAALFDNDQGSKIDFTANNVSLTIQKEAALPGSGTGQTAFSGSILSRFAEMQPSSTVRTQITQINPRAGEVFFYFRPVELSWTGQAESIKSLVLYLNGEPYGVVAENLPNTGRYTWTPSLSIPLTMVVPENTYAFQIVSQTKNQEAKSDPSIPIGIISDPNGTITPPDFQPKNADALTVESASTMLSQWGTKLTAGSELDLNDDLVINYLDWYLLRKALFVKDLVY